MHKTKEQQKPTALQQKQKDEEKYSQGKWNRMHILICRKLIFQTCF